MYAGTVFEYAPVRDIFTAPCHPYTVGLMASMPRLGSNSESAVRLNVIPGAVPPLYSLPAGCRFHDRCPFIMDICRKEEPVLKEISSGHYVRCWKC
jgi:oligopeptide/dipeptide ABC transporter ATP-binding protein